MLVTTDEFMASRYYKDEWGAEEVEEALAYAEARFYQLTGRERWGYWLTRKKLILLLDGSGQRLLRTPYPLLNLQKCKVSSVFGEADVTSDVRYRGHFLYLRGGWWEGFANVTVEGEFGDPAYAVGEQPEIPADVKEAVMRLANMKLRRQRITGERLTERRPPDEPVPPPTLTGDREVDGIIRTYTVRDMSFIFDVRGPLAPDEAEFEA